jgi:hypothetical protein
MGDVGRYKLVAIEPLLEEGLQAWPLPTDRATVVGLSTNFGMIAHLPNVACVGFFFPSSVASAVLLLIVVTCGVPRSGCDIVLPSKPLIPNLTEIVSSGVVFSAAANIRIRFEKDQKQWVVTAGETSWLALYGEKGTFTTERRITLPITGDSFAIFLGSTSGDLVSPYGEN